MLPTQHLGIKITIILRWDGPGVGLTTDLDTLVVREVDMLDERVSVERVEVEGGEGSEHGCVLGSGERRVGRMMVVRGWGERSGPGLH
jgi:hypothetical protein